MSYSYEFRTRRQQLDVFVEQELAALVDRGHFQRAPGLFANQLPRNDVGVVFQRSDDNLIPRLEPWTRIRLRNQIDRLRRPAHEDDLFRRAGMDEAPHALAGTFKRFRGRLTERVNAAMYVGV